eukprot:879464_1
MSRQNVTAKFLNLKQEMIYSKLCPMTIEQFNKEFKKAKIKFHSKTGMEYRISHIYEKLISYDTEPLHPLDYEKQYKVGKLDYDKYDYSSITRVKPVYSQKLMEAWHFLAVMIYCNYDTIQNELSNTYREIKANETKEDVSKRHSNFYWLGRYLSQAVCKFGTIGQESGVSSFYHGVREQMMFETID